MRPVKPTPKSALAALANADHPDQLVSPARMVATDNPAETERREAQARMPARRRNCCQFHHSANAKPSPAQLAPLDQREPMAHLEIMAALAVMVLLAHKDPLAHLVHLAPTETPDQLVPLVPLVP